MTGEFLGRAEPWMADGLCLQFDPDTFFPEKGHPDITRDAKRICGDCPAAPTCLAWALEHNEMWGIWGGLTALERERLRRGRRA